MKSKKLVYQIIQLKERHVELIDHSRNINHTCGLASNYSELMHRIADLLKTSKKALEGMQAHPETNQMETEYNIADVIGIAIKLLPYTEMQFIDETISLLDKADKVEK